MYDYTAQESDQLSFKEGDTIGIIEDLQDGWSRGDIGGYEGVYPTEYVQIIQEQQQTTPKATTSPEELAKRKEKREKLKEQLKAMKEELEQTQKLT